MFNFSILNGGLISFQLDQLGEVRNMELAIANLSLFYRQILKRIITCSLPNGRTLVIGLEIKTRHKKF